MKRNKVTLAVLLAALSFFAAPSASALSQSDVLAIKKAVADVPAAELAAKAAQLVSQAIKAEQQDVALTAVREVASKRPTVVVATVAAIAKVAPDLSAAVAGEAAQLATNQASEIAKAAVGSAPAHSQEIAAAVAKAAPKSATKVTRTVVTLVPDQTMKVVEKVLASVPSAQSEIVNDVVITRLTQRSALENGTNGIITTRGGTIRGTAAPDVPPISVGTATEGSDPRRSYGSVE
jgi:hypothetical protein